MPQDCGRATPRAKAAVTAASIALPPASSTSRPACEAAGDSEAITPPSLRTASLYREPSTADASPTVTRINVSVAAAKTRYMFHFPLNHRSWYTVCPPLNTTLRVLYEARTGVGHRMATAYERTLELV